MFENQEGKKVPQVTFKVRENGDFKELTSKELFDNRKVVVFSLPGAFTPTCSSTHLPRFNQLANVFKENGVDEIVCISVNDAFVMESWAKDQEANNVTLLPDADGEFSKGLGMLAKHPVLGNERSWRYSMLVNNGQIEKMFVEPQKEGDPFEVSDADTMLNYINASAKLPSSIAIISREGCQHCLRVKGALNAKGLPFEDIVLGKDITTVGVFALSGKSTFPQVFIDGKYIGGADETLKYLG